MQTYSPNLTRTWFENVRDRFFYSKAATGFHCGNRACGRHCRAAGTVERGVGIGDDAHTDGELRYLPSVDETCGAAFGESVHEPH